MKICIDAGHGGSDAGAIGEDPFRLEEKDLNLSLTLLLEQELEARGLAIAEGIQPLSGGSSHGG